MLAQIHTVLRVNFIQRNRQQQIVDVIAAEMRIAIGRLHFKDAVAQLQNGDIESAAAQIVDRNRAFLGAIEPVGQRRRGRLVHQPQHFKPRHAARIFCRLPLRVVEVRRNSDHGLRHRRAEEPLRIALELAQNVRRNFRRRKSQFAKLNARHLAGLHIVSKTKRKQLQLALHFFESAAHQALDGVDNPLRRLNQHACARCCPP